MKFVGVDLGWMSGASGLSCLDWANGQLRLCDLTCLTAIDDILDWLDHWLQPGEPGVVAVDAPTIIPNLTGMRVPDRLAHQQFGRYHAGCYPANLGLPFAQRTVAFGQLLEQRKFLHEPLLPMTQSAGRYQLEVYPHVAMIHLFRLKRILKYKKGRVAERRQGLTQLRQHILDRLPGLVPSLNRPDLMQIPEVPATGIAMKALEDCLDSLICAYVAAHWWYWGLEKNWVLGDRSTGYIVVPTPFGRHNSQTYASSAP